MREITTPADRAARVRANIDRVFDRRLFLDIDEFFDRLEDKYTTRVTRAPAFVDLSTSKLFFGRSAFSRLDSLLLDHQRPHTGPFFYQGKVHGLRPHLL